MQSRVWRAEGKGHLRFVSSFICLAFMQTADLSSRLNARRHLKLHKKEANLCFASEFLKPNPVQVIGGRNGEKEK